MRVLSYLFSVFFVLTLLTVVVFYVSRETMLWWAVYSFKTSVQKLAHISQGSYDSQCQQRLGAAALTASIQLRFLSSKEYVIEAACDQFSNAPILIEKGTLGMFVTKRPGTSGVLLGAESSLVELVVFENEAQAVEKYLPIPSAFLAKSRVVGLENMAVVSRSVVAGQSLGDGPVTSCEGYGYSCCNDSIEQGIGEQITGLSECKNTCFTSCVNRPVLLSLTSDPPLDLRSREVSISSGGGVQFYYVSAATDEDALQAIIDYGDGTQPGVTNGKSGTLSHVYSCLNRPCTYKAKLRLVDKWNVESSASQVSTVTVIAQ